MSINTPAALVESFKKSGEFERLRRELLIQFQQDDAYSGLKSKIDEIVRQRFADSPMLLYLSPENAFDEVGKEVARQVNSRAATSEAKVLSDPSFLSALQASIQKVLDDEKQTKDSQVTDSVAAASDSNDMRTPVAEHVRDKNAASTSTSDPVTSHSHEPAGHSMTIETGSSTAGGVNNMTSTAEAPNDASNVGMPHFDSNKEPESKPAITGIIRQEISGSSSADLPDIGSNSQGDGTSADDVVMADV
ncbi:hypothetical protein CVT24_002047 [Panaeolus cyanescens]|uniref:BOD1/SHG1 domain-containing protein n=1 Tax=Panaeolus cyanescens TaxID=181874 RepID=A0A409YHM4_9AGAR|nr:hypothetical protein CVT24_002047 [Panaeolus cyanescens]